MKKLFLLLMALFTLAQVKAQEKSVIQISTDNTDLILQVAPNGRLYQAYLGDKLLNEQDIKHFSPYVKGGSDGSVSTRGWEVYPGSGAEDYFEPAVAITHSDGNLCIFRAEGRDRGNRDNYQPQRRPISGRGNSALHRLSERKRHQDMERNQAQREETRHPVALCFHNALFLRLQVFPNRV